MVTDFEGSAFKDTSISSVTINAKVKSIRNGVFSDCSNLTSVTFPEGFEEIGYNLFVNCTSLESLELPVTLKNIGSGAFRGCTSLKFPDIPESLEYIGPSAFSYCKDLGNVTFPVKVSSLGAKIFTGSNISSIIWPEYNGEVSIAQNMFSEVTGIDEISFPKYVTAIWQNAFSGAKIKKIDLSKMPAKSKIGSHAFYGSSISEIIFPEQFNEISQYAFAECLELQSIVLPKEVQTTLGEYLFYNCKNLKSVTLPNNLAIIPSYCFSNCESLTEVIAPDCVNEIWDSAFYNCYDLAAFNMPSSLTSIGEYAFSHCSSLNSVDFPFGLKEIGQGAFSRCGKMTSVVFPEALSTIGARSFEMCSLNEVVIPSTMTSLGDYCFSANNLTKIEFSDRSSAPKLGENIFNGNSKLLSFTCPEWLEQIPVGFMSGCYNLSELKNFHPLEIRDFAFERCRKLQLVSLPQSIKSIGKSSFEQCGSSLSEDNYFIDELIVSDDVTIADEAFSEAKIKSLIVSGSEEYFKDKTKFGANVFENVTSIISVDFPDEMTRIPDGFCKGWYNLEEVGWPSKLKALGKSAFEGCSKLLSGEFDFNGDFPWNQITDFGDYSLAGNNFTSIKWPKSGEGITLGKGLFKNSHELKIGSIPEWMHDVPDELYFNSSSITDLSWGERVDDKPVNIGKRSFSTLTSLKEITFPEVETHLGHEAFSHCVSASIKWPSTPVKLGTAAFSFCCALDFEDFPEYITEIPNYCFEYCSSLKRIRLHENITSIGSCAFQYCDKLKEITVFGNIANVKSYAFYSCSALENITFKHNIENIDNGVFQYCKSLKEINFSEDQGYLRKLGYSIFDGCSSLKTVSGIIGPETEFGWDRFYSEYWCRRYQDCTSLKAAEYIAYGLGKYAFDNDINLQSVSFKSKGGFRFWNPVGEVPLLGVSTQPVKLTSAAYAFDGTEEKEKKGVLMVARGDRWKYEEAGYNRIWDIREYRPAETAISGTIHSQFKEGDTRNDYTAYLSWEVNLCDLNPEGETSYTLWRRGNTDVEPTKVATLHIEQPHAVSDGVNDLNVMTNDPLVVAKIQVESPDGTLKDKESTHIDFDLLTGEDLYEMKSSNQHGSLYFDPETTRRVGTSEAMGTESRLLFIDRFSSPDLNGAEGPVPDYYDYYVTASAFEYDEPVNNDNYDVDSATGLAYHLEHRMREAFTSEVCRVYTPMALPSLQFNGIYSTEEVMADTDGTLRDSNLYNDRGEIKLNYSYHPDVIRHREQENSTTKYVVQNITCYQIDNDTKDRLLSQTVNHDSPNGTVTTREIKPNTTFHMVTETFARGTFGSRAVHVYGAPTLQLSAGAFQVLGWDGHSHPEGAISSKLQLIPDVSQMGYTGDKLTLNAANHRFGLWRTTTVTAPETPLMTAADGDGATASEVLVHHFDGPVEENFTNSCETCAALRGYDPETLSYTDIIAAAPDYGGKVHADYRGRLYVQLADDPYHWMVAEARATPPYEHTNGIDDIPSEIPDGAVFYDLQGRRVVNPAQGGILIMVTSRGSYKIRY